jgi:cytochrome P450
VTITAVDIGPGGDLTAPLLDPEFYAGNPFPFYARLRLEDPVARNQQLGLWMVSRHAEVTEVSRDTGTYCSSKGIMVFEIGAEYPTPPTMMHTDLPDHTRYRGLVQPGFRPTFIRGLEDSVRSRTAALVDRIEAGTPIDVVADLAVPLLL